MIDPAIIEAAARALRSVGAPRASYNLKTEAVIVGVDEASAAVLATVTPLIETATLERAAMEAEKWDAYSWRNDANDIAAAIRALKEQP